MSVKPLLVVDGLRKYFPVHGGILYRELGRVHAVDRVSLTIHEGETVGLVGESGCGKSTFGRTVLRLYEPTEGKVEFLGKDLAKLGRKDLRALRRDMQIIFQDPFESLNSRHTVGQILEEPFLIHRIGTAKTRRKAVDQLLERVGLPASAVERFPHEFSGGQRQRIGIARAVALKPKLIICDEPVSALDVSIQSQILNLLLELQVEMGLSYLFIAHDLAVVKHVSDRVAVMYLGRIVEFADADEIYAKPMHPYTQVLISAVPVPDPRHRSTRLVVKGEVPSPLNPPSGCHFHTRCPYVKDLCRQEIPALRQAEGVGESHLVACHFAEDIQQQRG